MLKQVAVFAMFCSVNAMASSGDVVFSRVDTVDSSGENVFFKEALELFYTIQGFILEFGEDPSHVVSVKREQENFDINFGLISNVISGYEKEINQSESEIWEGWMDPKVNNELQAICPLILLCVEEKLIKDNPNLLPFVAALIQNINVYRLTSSEHLFSPEIIECMRKYVSSGDVRSLTRTDGGLIAEVLQKPWNID